MSQEERSLLSCAKQFNAPMIDILRQYKLSREGAAGMITYVSKEFANEQGETNYQCHYPLLRATK